MKFRLKIRPRSSESIVRVLPFSPTIAAALFLGLPGAGAIQQVKLNPPLVSGGDVVSNYEFTPDGSRIVYVADQETDGTIELYSVPAGGGTVVKLNGALKSDNVGFFTISPDSSRVVYSAAEDTADKRELYSVPVAGGLRIKLNAAVHTGVDDVFFEISPDSSRVAYMADQDTSGIRDLYVAPLAGGLAVKLNVALASGDFIDSHAFSPDNSRVVYSVFRSASRSAELYSVPVAGGASVRLNPSVPDGHGVMEFMISPDSAHVVFRSGENTFMGEDCDLYSVPIASGTPVRLNDPLGSDETVYEDFQIAPDSSRVVYMTDETEPGYGLFVPLYSVALAGGTPALLCTVSRFGPFDTSRVVNFEIAPDSAHVFYLADQDTNDVLEIYRVPIAGGGQIRLNPPLPAGRSVWSFRMCCDGAHVAYRADQDSVGLPELFSVPSGGGTPVKLNADLSPDQDISEFQSSPDGSRIVFSLSVDASGHQQLYSAPAEGGAAAVRIDTGTGRISDFTIAPDNACVVYCGDHETTGVYEIFGLALETAWQSAGGRWEGWSNWNLGAPNSETVAVVGIPATVVLDAEWASFSAHSLRLGGSSSGSSVLKLTGGAALGLHGGLDLLPGGVLGGDGSISAGYRPLDIPAGAEIRASDGERLHISGGPVANAGIIDAIGLDATAEIAFDAALTNRAGTGYLAAHNAVLRFGSGLANLGSLGITGESNQIFGDIDNGVGGRIIVSGGAAAIFQGDVANSGSINVSASGSLASAAVFFGGFSGNGTTGGGHVFLEGDTRPGFSPGTMAFGGDLSLGPQHILEIQIAGTEPGAGYDRIEVAGALDLAGSLAVSFIDGFAPQAGNSFDLWDAGSASGAFSSVSLPALPAGLFWHDDALNADGILSVAIVPESYAEFAAAYSLAGGPDDDGDADGIPNLLEYLHGLDPTSADFASPLSLVRTPAGEDELSFFLASPGGADASLELQTSTDMDAWTPLATRAPDGAWSGPLPVTVAPAGPGRSRIVLTRPADAARRFYRLAASLRAPRP